MKKNLGRTLLALTIGLSMVGCAKQASNPVTPNNPSVVNPVGSNLNPSCGDVTPTPVPPPPVAVIPLCNYIAFTSFIGGHFKLFLYDDILKDNYALPGAGEDINNPEYYDAGKIIFDRNGCILVYDLLAETVCSLNDINSITCTSGCFDNLNDRCERPFLARPAASWDGTRVVFIADELGHRRRDLFKDCGFNDKFIDLFDGIAGSVWLWECGNACYNVCELSKINAIACQHGGVTWVDISADGRWIVFTTGDGQLWVYDILNPMVCLIADANDIGARCGDKNDLVYLLQPSISATGKQIVFSAVTMDEDGFVRTTIWRYDRILGCLDPMPFANAALNADRLCLEFRCEDEHRAFGDGRDDGRNDCDQDHRFNKIRGIGGLVLNPKFKCYDEETIYYEALVPGLCEGTVRGFEVLAYNWVTETVRTLSILNNVVATDVINLVSDLYGPYFCVDVCSNCGRSDCRGDCDLRCDSGCDQNHEHHW